MEKESFVLKIVLVWIVIVLGIAGYYFMFVEKDVRFAADMRPCILKWIPPSMTGISGGYRCASNSNNPCSDGICKMFKNYKLVRENWIDDSVGVTCLCGSPTP